MPSKKLTDETDQTEELFRRSRSFLFMFYKADFLTWFIHQIKCGQFICD